MQTIRTDNPNTIIWLVSEYTSMYSGQFCYCKCQLFICNLNMKTQSIKISEQIIIIVLIQFRPLFSSKVSAKVFTTFWFPFSRQQRVGCMPINKIISLSFGMRTLSTSYSMLLTFKYLQRREKPWFSPLSQKQTHKQKFAYIRFQKELEYISVPELN